MLVSPSDDAEVLPQKTVKLDCLILLWEPLNYCPEDLWQLKDCGYIASAPLY